MSAVAVRRVVSHTSARTPCIRIVTRSNSNVPTRSTRFRASSASETAPSGDSKIRMLYDGDCPLCMREVDMLRKRNETYSSIEFVDIADRNYSPEQNAGISYEAAMKEIHAIDTDGKVVTGVAVFRRLYEAVGLGWVYAATKVPWVGRAAEQVYGVWAKYRMQITGRADLDVILERRKREDKGEAMTCKGE